MLLTQNITTAFTQYQQSPHCEPLFLQGDALAILPQLPANSVDVCLTSPPYWGQRHYQTGGLGTEETPQAYLAQMAQLCQQIHRILKPTGSFWLNLGDSYRQKSLAGIPWRLALHLVDEQGWILRNDVIWHKVKGGLDNTQDRLRNVHEYIFHFVKQPKGYFYDVDAIRTAPRQAHINNGAVVSATGVTGVRYKRQIELSTALSLAEKKAAQDALAQMMQAIAQGELSDFRMIIRGQQRPTHSNEQAVSGRARELAEKGFYFLRYHPKGSKPSDVWDILPEDTQNRANHYAAYPEELCRIPILATCPKEGIVLDPFVGTGTTTLAARNLARKSVGIDISPDYLQMAEARCQRLL